MENNNISSNKKISIGRLIIMSFILMIVVIGGTFAWFTFSSNKSALVLTIGDINDAQIKLSPYEINATMVPSNTYSDGVYSDVEISKGNNNSTSFTLFYKINNLDTKLIDNGLSYTIVNTETDEIVKDGKFSELIDASEGVPEEVIILNTDTDTSVVANSTTNFRTYLWLDSSVGDQTDIQDSTLELELNGSIGSVTISGDNIYGGTLTASLADSVVDPSITYGYQWYYNTSATTSGGTLIEGANKTSYTIGDGMPGKYIYLVVTTSSGKTLSAVMDEAVAKADCSCSISSYPTQLGYPLNSFGVINYTCSGDGEIYATSSISDVIAIGDVSETSTTLNAVSVGTSEITIGRNENDNYNACSSMKDISVIGGASLYNITYDLDGGSVSNANPATYTMESDDITLNTPTKSGYTFMGWRENQDGLILFHKESEVTYSGNTITFTNATSGNTYYSPKIQLSNSSGVFLQEIGSGKNVNGTYVHTRETGNYVLNFSVNTSIDDAVSQYSVYLVKDSTYVYSWETVSATSNKVVVKNFRFYKQNAGNVGIPVDTIATGSYGDRSYTAIWADLGTPVLSLSKTGTVEGFRGWNLSNGASLNVSTQELNLGTGSAISPYIPVGEQYYGWSFSIYPGNASSYLTPRGSMYYATNYYDSNFDAKVGSNGYSGNGHAPGGTVETWTSVKQDNNYNYGSGIEYFKINPGYSSTYSSTSMKIKNMKIYGNNIWAKNYVINVTASDNVGITTKKYAPGNQSASYFASSGTNFTGDSITVTENGTYTVYVADAAGNSTVQTITIDRIDKTPPTITTYSGKILYEDAGFNSGMNSIFAYDISGNGSVTVTRKVVAGSSDYGIEITTTGAASPGHGGFAWGLQSAANKEFIVIMDAKIPVGYYIEFHSNAIGSSSWGSSNWLTSQQGTGNWQTYVFRIKCDSSGTFSSTAYFALHGGSTATSSNPVTWYLSYATIFDTGLLQDPYYITSVAYDGESGVAALNAGTSTEPSTWYQYTINPYRGTYSGSVKNGNQYIWYADAAGNVASKTVYTGNTCIPNASASAANKSYTGSAQTGVTGSNVTWSGTTSATNASSYTAYATPASGYCWSDGSTGQKTITWSISRVTGSTIGSCVSRTYTGSAQTLASGGSYVTYSNNSRINAGSQTVTVNADGNHTFSDGSTSKTLSCSIAKFSPTLTQSATSGSVYVGSTTTYTVKSNVAGKFTVASNATGKATVTIDSTAATAANTNRTVTITGVSTGSATITVTFTPTDTTNYNSTSKTYTVSSSIETINAYRYSCEAANRMSKLWVTTCNGATCAYTARNNLNSSFSFANDLVTTSPSWSVNKSNFVSSLSSLSSSCPKKTIYTSGVSSNLNCRVAPNASTDIVVAFRNSFQLTGYESTMKYDSSNRWWYISNYECYAIGSYLSTTDPTTAAGSLTEESTKCYNTCNALGRIPRQYNQNCYCCPSNTYIASGSVTSSCSFQYNF